ncbi:hypothetical protein NL676_035883 [Syzygium grande]|nr:hypothetical protein NL676_035883 [Syzygium grande]
MPPVDHAGFVRDLHGNVPPRRRDLGRRRAEQFRGGRNESPSIDNSCLFCTTLRTGRLSMRSSAYAWGGFSKRSRTEEGQHLKILECVRKLRRRGRRRVASTSIASYERTSPIRSSEPAIRTRLRVGGRARLAPSLLLRLLRRNRASSFRLLRFDSLPPASAIGEVTQLYLFLEGI